MRMTVLFLRSLALAAVVALTTSSLIQAQPFPEVIPLPDGFQPEGIVTGRGSDFYVGSLANGAIYNGDLRTGEGDLLVAGETGRVAVGMSFDLRTGFLFVAGGGTGFAHVYDARTGEEVGEFQFAASDSFINDVVVTKHGAYFTDSANPVLYVVPLAPNGGLPEPSEVEALPLSGDWAQVSGFNANGIDATPDGSKLVVVNSSQGALYVVDPNTGIAAAIDLGEDTVASGDGILLHGKTLYVVRNFFNLIAVVELDPHLASGAVVDEITSPHFRIPTTIAKFGNALYAVNARFDVSPGPDVEYEVVRVATAE